MSWSKSYSTGGSIVRRCDCAESLAASGVVEIDLMALLEGGEPGAGSDRGEGCHDRKFRGGERKVGVLSFTEVCTESPGQR